MFGSYFTLYELCGNQVRLYLRMLRVYLRTSDLLGSVFNWGFGLEWCFQLAA